MYYHTKKNKKELGIENHLVDRNVVEEICDISKKADSDDFVKRYILNKCKSKLPCFVLYFNRNL